MTPRWTPVGRQVILSTAGKLAGAMRSINPAEIRLVVADEVDEIFSVRIRAGSNTA